MMKKRPEMVHTTSNMVTVAPGQSGEVIRQFTKGGEIDCVCLEPGHFDAGLKDAVMVSESTQ